MKSIEDRSKAVEYISIKNDSYFSPRFTEKYYYMISQDFKHIKVTDLKIPNKTWTIKIKDDIKVIDQNYFITDDFKIYLCDSIKNNVKIIWALELN